MKMKKKVFISIVGIVLFIIVFVIYKVLTFSLFDDEVKEVAKINVPNKNFRIGIFYLPSNATSQDYIQVRKIGNGVENVIESFERYDFIVETELKGDSLLSLILKDTSRNVIEQDTFLINLK
jgi:hypothetical protein